MTTNNAIQAYGDRDELKELGFRLQKMMPSAQSFTGDEALAVAQIARAHDLDPFNGEVWGLKSYNGQWYGVMVGIKGLRKCARRAAAAENGSYWIDNREVEAKKYNVNVKDAVVYECILRDSVNMQAYGQAIHALTDSGIPYKEAVEMVGPAPQVVGVGIADPSEKSKMGLHARAKKRAEADALKQRYDVDFGSATFTVEDQEDAIDAVEVTPDAFDQGVDTDYPPEDEILDELGYEPKQAELLPRAPGEPNCTPQFLVDEGIVSNTKHAEALMSLLQIEKGAPAQASLDRIGLYNNWRKIYPKNDAQTRQNCAEKAISGEIPE